MSIHWSRWLIPAEFVIQTGWARIGLMPGTMLGLSPGSLSIMALVESDGESGDPLRAWTTSPTCQSFVRAFTTP